MKKTVFQQFAANKLPECVGLKFILSGVFGFVVGYAYFYATFSSAFGREEKRVHDILKWTTVGLSVLGCSWSIQCCCIGALCVPNMVTKSGRGILQAMLAAWILSGPVTHIMHHSTEAVRSVSCVAKLQSDQMKNLMEMLHSPVTTGFRRLVDESLAVNKSQQRLEKNLRHLQYELATDEFGEKNKEVPDAKTLDLGNKLQKDTVKRCEGLFEYGVEECKKIFRKKEQECHDTIGVPFIKDILCFALKATFLCNLVSHFDSWCQEVPDIDKKTVNKNYSDLDNTLDEMDAEFETELYWETPVVHEEAAVLTMDEIVMKIQEDYKRRQLMLETAILFAQKIIAISFIFVLKASSNYNKQYLTDYRFDNFYVTYYFTHKDRERRLQGKRNLLPLTRLEKRTIIDPTDWSLTTTEKKTMTFKLIKLIIQILFACILFLFDYVIYTILALITKHGKIDFQVTGRHKLEVQIGGNGTVAALLQELFSPYRDNEHTINSNTTNIECLPRASPMDTFVIIWIGCGYGALLVMIFIEAYVLRLRHYVCATFYHRREKRRIVFLYNELLRCRKKHIVTVRKTIRKLARIHKLNQKYSFLEAVRVKYKRLGKAMTAFGIGKHKCLICETKESGKQPLIRCSNDSCRILYCRTCWKEVKERCWACDDKIESEHSDEDSTTAPPVDEDTSDMN